MKPKNIADVIDNLPTDDDKRRLLDVMNNNREPVEIRGKKVYFGSLYNDTLDKVSDIILNEKKEDKVIVKCYAAMRLNGYFKLRMFYWILWRWYYYVSQYTYDELAPAIDMARKKVSEMWLNYVVDITSLTGLMTTTMAMTRKEAKHFQAEQVGVLHGIAEVVRKGDRESHTSPNQDDSSSVSSKSNAGDTGAD